MSRVALLGPYFRPTTPASFAIGCEVWVYERGTDALATIYAGETGGATLEQPLVTNGGGCPRGKGGELPWVDDASYDIELNGEGERLPDELAKGGATGGGGGAVDSVAGKTGDVTLEVADIAGLGDAAVRDVGPGAGDVAAGNVTASLVAELEAAGAAVVFAGSDAAKARPTGFAAVLWIVEGIEPEHREPHDPVFDLSAVPGEEEGGAVSSVFGRTGDVVAAANDYAVADIEGLAAVIAALESSLAGKQASLGYTAENVANKVQSISGGSETEYPSEKAVELAIAAALANADVMEYKGVKDCSANPNYPAADAGHVYVVSVAGKIGGASGTEVEAGDMLICKTDSSASGNQATVGANWNIIERNDTGVVSGPASSTNDRIATFSGTTGKAIQDGGSLISDLVAKSLVTTKGDLIVATASATVARKAAGTNGKVLAAESGESDGLKWVGNTDSDPRGFAIAGKPEVKTYPGWFEPVVSGETKKLIGMKYRIAGGTKAKITLLQNGAAVTGFKEVEVKTEAGEVSGKSVSISNGDEFALKVETAEGSIEYIEVTAFIERTHS